MELPEIAKRIGKIENRRKIYIEDYVLSYLECFKFEGTEENERIVLYGKSVQNASEEIYIIYGAEKRKADETGVKEDIFSGYEEVGCLNTEMWKNAQGMCEGILVGDGNGGQPLEGYYIFYEKDPVMGKYLGFYYEEEIRKPKYLKKSELKSEEEESGRKQAELIALSENEIFPESPVYNIIRAAVICIFIIICAIAITTVNSFTKMQEFSSAAAQMSEVMEELK